MNGNASTAGRMRTEAGAGLAAILALGLLLGGCKGGSSGGAGTGTATPPPLSSPPPPPSSLPLPPFGITASQHLPVFGWVYRQGSLEPRAVGAEVVDLRWSATAGSYELHVAEIGSGTLKQSFPGKNFIAFDLVDSAGAALPLSVTLDPGNFWDVDDRSTGLLSLSRRRGR